MEKFLATASVKNEPANESRLTLLKLYLDTKRTFAQKPALYLSDRRNMMAVMSVIFVTTLVLYKSFVQIQKNCPVFIQFFFKSYFELQ